MALTSFVPAIRQSLNLLNRQLPYLQNEGDASFL